jgi:hypothetical protein
MNKHLKTIYAYNVIADLPKLPFVTVHNVRDEVHEHVSNLPQAQLNLVDTATASGARILLRFTDVTLDEHTDAGVAATLLGSWVKKLLDGLNEKEGGERYRLATPTSQPRPYMPPMGFRPAGEPWRPGMFDQSQGRWPNARFGGMMPQAFGSFEMGAYPKDQDEYQAFLVAQSLLRDIGETNFSSVPSLSVVYTQGKEGPYLRFEAALGHGITLSASPVPDTPEMAYVSFFDEIQKSGAMAGYFHVGGKKYLYTTGHQHGYCNETRSLLTQAAISRPFNELWEKYHKAMGLNALPVQFDAL